MLFHLNIPIKQYPMEQFFYENFGITENTLNYIVLPLLIFIARIGDVTLSTIRIIFVMSGNKAIAPILGFFEALIWLIAIGQIFNNIDNIWSYLGYAGGYAVGTYVGMMIEEKLAIGRVVVRLITNTEVDGFLNFLNEHNYRYSIIDADGRKGKVNVVFLVIKRDQLNHLTAGINEHHPKSFYTIEGVKKVKEGSHDGALSDTPTQSMNLRWLQLKRK